MGYRLIIQLNVIIVELVMTIIILQVDLNSQLHIAGRRTEAGPASPNKTTPLTYIFALHKQLLVHGTIRCVAPRLGENRNL